MPAVLYSEAARADIELIWAQVAATNGETVAERVIDRIERRAASLVDYPLLGPARPDIADGARSLLVERWLILYRVVAKAIEIVRVVDGARDLRKPG
ncbi:MAG TPA: type II toxin-antitoxin system RelE/ParE family toxin [Rhodoblastus sp.]|nr:type II toxin-antitoxin system RelE/ParE family toxin [Rhodoblastus sp.]